MGLLCLTPDTTPILLVLKEHPGWVEGQGPLSLLSFRDQRQMLGYRKGNQVLPWGSPESDEVTRSDPAPFCQGWGETPTPPRGRAAPESRILRRRLVRESFRGSLSDGHSPLSGMPGGRPSIMGPGGKVKSDWLPG